MRLWRWGSVVAVGVGVAACGSWHRAPMVSVPTCVPSAYTSVVAEVYVRVLQRTVDPNGLAYYGTRLCDGRMDVAAMEAHIKASDEYRALTARPIARRGLVRLNNRVFVDDDGPFFAHGLTFFAAGWAYTHDRARLEANLAVIAKTGAFDYIRVLGAVGGSSWEDRAFDPRVPEYDAVLAGLTDLAYTYGLRVEWTIFGGVDATPTPASREAVVRRFVAMSQGREHKIMHWEVANESWQNGFDGEAGRAELRRLGAILAAETPIRVALSAPADDADATALYSESAADLFTIHLDRNVTGQGLRWRPVRQPWEVQFLRGIPRAWTSNEPIGPQSSVEADADPWRLVLSAGVVAVAGGAGYVYHTGPGVRFGGAADVARGRVANFAEVEGFAETTAGLVALERLLPADVANWTRHNSNANFPRYPFDTASVSHAIEAGDLLRAFCATTDAEFVCLPIKVERAVDFTARAPMQVTVLHPLTGETVRTVTLAAGQTLTLEPTLPAYVLRGVLAQGAR